MSARYARHSDAELAARQIAARAAKAASMLIGPGGKCVYQETLIECNLRGYGEKDASRNYPETFAAPGEMAYEPR
jgi:hypothetical protein